MIGSDPTAAGRPHPARARSRSFSQLTGASIRRSQPGPSPPRTKRKTIPGVDEGDDAETGHGRPVTSPQRGRAVPATAAAAGLIGCRSPGAITTVLNEMTEPTEVDARGRDRQGHPRAAVPTMAVWRAISRVRGRELRAHEHPEEARSRGSPAGGRPGQDPAPHAAPAVPAARGSGGARRTATGRASPGGGGTSPRCGRRAVSIRETAHEQHRARGRPCAASASSRRPIICALLATSMPRVGCRAGHVRS